MMSYEDFRIRVSDFVDRSGSKASFSHEDGIHIARCSNGVVITGNAYCIRVCVKWGSGHRAYATI